MEGLCKWTKYPFLYAISVNIIKVWWKNNYICESRIVLVTLRLKNSNGKMWRSLRNGTNKLCLLKCTELIRIILVMGSNGDFYSLMSWAHFSCALPNIFFPLLHNNESFLKSPTHFLYPIQKQTNQICCCWLVRHK